MMTVASNPSRTMTRSENQNTESFVVVRCAPAARSMSAMSSAASP